MGTPPIAANRRNAATESRQHSDIEHDDEERDDVIMPDGVRPALADMEEDDDEQEPSGADPLEDKTAQRVLRPE